MLQCKIQFLWAMQSILTPSQSSHIQAELLLAHPRSAKLQSQDRTMQPRTKNQEFLKSTLPPQKPRPESHPQQGTPQEPEEQLRKCKENRAHRSTSQHSLSPVQSLRIIFCTLIARRNLVFLNHVSITCCWCLWFLLIHAHVLLFVKHFLLLQIDLLIKRTKDAT